MRLSVGGRLAAAWLTAAGFGFWVSAASAQDACPDTFQQYGPGLSLTCVCAPAQISGTVWGSSPYTDDSSVCAAARHAGVIGADGGTIGVTGMAGQDSYAGSSANGISTLDYGQWGASFVVGKPTGGVASCPSNFVEYRGSGSSVTCECAAPQISGTVWGSGPYTDDSSVCAAARHAGIIGPNGGTVTAEATPGLDSYSGSASNGVTTLNYGPWSGSFTVR